MVHLLEFVPIVAKSLNTLVKCSAFVVPCNIHAISVLTKKSQNNKSVSASREHNHESWWDWQSRGFHNSKAQHLHQLQKEEIQTNTNKRTQSWWYWQSNSTEEHAAPTEKVEMLQTNPQLGGWVIWKWQIDKSIMFKLEYSHRKFLGDFRCTHKQGCNMAIFTEREYLFCNQSNAKIYWC